MTIARVDRPRRAGAVSKASATGGTGSLPLRRRQRRRSRLTALAFVAPLLAYLAAFYVYPLYRNLDLSLRDYTVRSFVQGGAPFIGAKNYSTVLHDPVFGSALVHTLVFTLVSLAFQFTIGMALSFFKQKTAYEMRV